MTDISISDIERITHSELDRKIEQLSFYLNRVQQRIDALHKQSPPLNSSTNQKVNQKINRLVKSNSKLKVSR